MQSYLLASASTTDADEQTMIMIIIFMVIINKLHVLWCCL